MKEKKIKYSQYFILLLILMLATIIRGFNLGEMSIGSDECFSAYVAQLSPTEIITWLNTGDNPPLWELFLHYWIQLFGISEYAIRFPSLIFSVLTIIPIYFIGEKFVNKNVGVLASILFTFSSFSLFFAQEARIYNLLGFLSVTSVYLFLCLIKNPKAIKTLILLTVVNTLILYSHYIGYWVILVQILMFFSFKNTLKPFIKRYLIHLLALFISFTPLIPVIINRFFKSGLKGTWIDPVNSIDSLYNMLWNFSNAPVVTVVFIIILLAALIKKTSFKSLKKEPIPYSIIINSFVWIPLIISFLLSFRVGFFLDRYFYFTSPFFYLSVAISLNYLYHQSGKINILINSILILLMLFTFNISTKSSRISGYHQNTRLISDEIKNINKKSLTAIIICPSWYDKEIMYYLDKNVFSTYFEHYNETSSFKKPFNDKNIYFLNHYSKIPSTITGFSKILFIDKNADFNVPKNGIKNHLSIKYSFFEEYKIDDVIFSTFLTN